MSTKKRSLPKCELCEQEIKLQGFNLDTIEGKKSFCCQGCLSIYQLLNPDKILSKNK